jgi:glycopeptide antibiotics resistance protein
MTFPGALLYMAGALAYALLPAGVILSVVAVRRGRRPSADLAFAVLLALFILFLGLHPFPDWTTLDCSDGGVAPLLTPFGFIEGFVQLWRAGASPSVWLHDLSVMSPVMNFVFFALLGGLLARQTSRPGLTLLFVAGLSGLIEIAQISALFGIYPCPYRHFEIDDLILNISGGMAGFGLVRMVRMH